MSIKLVLLLLSLSALAQPAGASSACFAGKMDFAAHGTTIPLSFTIKDNILTVESPDHSFDPGAPVALIPMAGDHCATCTALQNERGNFTFKQEPTETGAMQTAMNYFDMPVAITDLDSCSESKPKK